MLLVTYTDALDALPLEFTRSFSDLRELDAVLGAHLASLSLRVQHLAAIIEDTNVSPEERFMALRDAAEEARAYKMGGEDKVRVAINTSEMVRSFLFADRWHHTPSTLTHCSARLRRCQ